MSEISFEIQDFSDQVLKAEKEQVAKALYIAGLDIVKDTIMYMSEKDFTGRDMVDTGKLRQSISFITSEAQSGKNSSQATEQATVNDIITGRANQNELIWGSNVEYADFVNNGTIKQPARKFLQNGFYKAKNNVEKHIEKTLKGEL